MIPPGDGTRRPIHFPITTLAIIAANALVFVLELLGGDPFISYWSLVPTHIMAGQDWITILTSMFMHAGWEHILGNMLFFWVFAPEIEDVMGVLPFLTFYLLGGLTATAAQVLVDPASTKAGRRGWYSWTGRSKSGRAGNLAVRAD
jgi:membrane associated rhomboid family serine protease